MQLKSHEGERGQTVPFWVFATIISLALTLFMMNYTNTIRWHIRAQNAADTAAMAAIAADANLNNQQTVAQYALAVSEYRIRAIVESMVNAANGSTINPTGIMGGGFPYCEPSQDDNGYDCDNAYDQEPESYDKAVADYQQALTYLKSLKSAAPPSPVAMPTDSHGNPIPLPSAPAGSAAPAAFSLAASGTNCWDSGIGKPIFDCSFYYTANPDLSQTGLGSNEYVDIIACRNVTQTGPALFHGPTQFVAEGRGAASLRAITTTFNPGDTPDPSQTPNPAPGATQPPFQPVESCPPNLPGNPGPCDLSQGWMATTPYVVDFSGLTVQATFFVPAPVAPQGGINSNTVVACKQG
ncbi:MAG: hypothetical protein ACLPYS_19745 [Vulcanimicrobiaceae bacterium]